MTTWSEAFARHLAACGLSQQDALFALRRARVRATPSQISYWCRGARPRERTRAQLERWSKGAVPADLPAVRIESSTDVTAEAEHSSAS